MPTSHHGLFGSKWIWLILMGVGAALIVAANVRTADLQDWLTACTGWSLPLDLYSLMQNPLARPISVTMGLMILILAVTCRS
ncbi:MAG: hypothetical protein ACT4QC_20305 [Planctomycetaceae bacterium]